jgi:hypothetical protein
VSSSASTGATPIQRLVERKQLAGDLLADRAVIVAVVDLEVRLHEIDERQVRRRLAVGHRAAFEDRARLARARARELVEQARLADAGLADHATSWPWPAAARCQAACRRSSSASAPDEAREPARSRRCSRVRTGSAPVSSKASTELVQPLDVQLAERRTCT